MAFNLALAQTGYPRDGDALAQVEACAAAAAEAGVGLLAFPENLMHPHELTVQQLCALAEPIEGPFAQGVAAIARTYGLWIAFTMNETNPSGEPPYNTACVVDDEGCVRGSYRKCHLYDAHSVRESDRMTAGGALCRPIQTPFATIGLGICYDLRFPEVARAAATLGCDVLLFPACWHDGPHKREHWETLLRARAIENECFVAGICHAGSRYVERSMVVDPLGSELTAQVVPIPNTNDTLFVARIDLNEVTAARDAMPILHHRRPSLYTEVAPSL